MRPGPVSFDSPISVNPGGGGATHLDRRFADPMGGAAGSSVVSPFAITSVSQTAGRAAGGTVLFVEATGIVGTPTTTLGAVSGVTGTSFEVTTDAHAAATVSWTATNGNGAVSAAQSYTYLAAPTFTTLTPSEGAQTIATSGVVVGGTNFPPSGSGCPVTLTVDGEDCAPYVLIGSTSFSCEVPTSSSAGAFASSVTVDGVAASGSVTWTWKAPPTIAGVSSIYTAGGSGSIGGTGFDSGTTATVNINGTVYPLSITFDSSTTLEYVLPTSGGPYTPSTGTGWPLTVTDSLGQATTQNAFVITAVPTPSAILGADLIINLDPVTYTGSVWDDSTGYAQNLGTIAGTITVNGSSAHMNGRKSLGFASGSSISGAFSLQGGSTLWLAMVTYRSGTTPSTYYTLASYGTSGGGTLDFTYREINALGQAIGPGGSPVAQGASSSALATIGSYAYVSGGTPNVSGYLEGVGGTETTASAGSGALLASGFLMVGNQLGASASFVGEYGYFLGARIKPSSTQELQIYQFFNSLFDLEGPPSVTRVTPMQVGGGLLRIQGTGFNASGTVTTALGTTTAFTALTSDVIQTTIPAGSYAPGSYDITVTNASGLAFTLAGGLQVVAAADVWSRTAPNVVGWYRSDSAITLGSGTNIAAQGDLSCTNNDQVQATSAEQPTLDASNANFNGAPTVHFPVGTFLETSAFATTGDGSGTGFMWAACLRINNPPASGHYAIVFSYDNGAEYELRCDPAGTSELRMYSDSGTYNAAFTTNVAGSTIIVYGYGTPSSGGAGTTAIGVYGFSEVDTSSSGLSLPSGLPLSIAARTDGSSGSDVDVAEWAVWNVKLSSAQMAGVFGDWQTEYG